MKIGYQCLWLRNREVGCKSIAFRRRYCATYRIQYVMQRHCVICVRRSEQRSDLFFMRQNVQTFRPLNTGTSRCPETPCANHPMTRRTVKYFKIKTDYIYLNLNSKYLAE